MAEGISQGEQKASTPVGREAERQTIEQKAVRVNSLEAARLRAALERAGRVQMPTGVDTNRFRYQQALHELQQIRQSNEQFLEGPQKPPEVPPHVLKAEARDRQEAQSSEPPEMYPSEDQTKILGAKSASLLLEVIRLAQREEPPDGMDIAQFRNKERTRYTKD